jgi:hypothetical protein
MKKPRQTRVKGAVDSAMWMLRNLGEQDNHGGGPANVTARNYELVASGGGYGCLGGGAGSSGGGSTEYTWIVMRSVSLAPWLSTQST